MDLLTVQDVELSAQIYALRTRLNAASELRLYVGEMEVTTDMDADTFIAPTYQGYAPIDLVGQWQEPEQLAAGCWAVSIDFVTFAVQAGPGIVEQEVNGVYVTAGDDVLFAGPLPGPVLLARGGVALTFRLEVQLRDSSVIARLLFS